MLTFNPQTNEVKIFRGDAETLRVSVKNSSGALYDVSGNSFKFTVKASLDDPIVSALFQLLSPAVNGIDLTSGPATAGLVDVKFAVANAALLSMAGRYFYDFEMTDSVGAHTLLRGDFIVPKDISTPGSVPVPAAVGAAFPGFVSIAGADYHQDQATGLWFKEYYSNGVKTTVGPQAGPPPFAG